MYSWRLGRLDVGSRSVTTGVFEEVKKYVRFGHEDGLRVVAVGAVVEPHFDRVVEAFYERVREHPQAHAVLRDEDQVTRLKVSLALWLKRLFSGPYDAAYADKSAQIGRVHVRVGLPQRYAISALALIRSNINQILAEASRSAREIDSVNRLLDMELALMLETYHEDFVARIQAREERERRNLGFALEAAELRYVHAVETAPVLILAIDIEEKLLLVNAEVERTTGYARDQLLGRGLRESGMLSPDAVLRAIEDGKSQELESTLLTRAAKPRTVVWTIVQSTVDARRFLFGRDVTAERASAIRAMRNERLAAAGTLAAGLAHEIRNPLNGAKLHLTFLERRLKRSASEQEGRDTLDAVGVVHREIDRLSHLVTDFLDFARPHPLTCSDADLRDVCRHAVEIVLPEAEGAGIRVLQDLPASPIHIKLDSRKFEQVLINLMRNSIEAIVGRDGPPTSPRGEVVLRVRRAPEVATIDVTDNGPGPTGDPASLFDPFYSTKPTGTGLGLSIVHRIVTDHGGHITLSRAGGLTICSMTLPMSLESHE